MNRRKETNPQAEPIDRELDRILLHEDALLPSSGFAASVMHELQREVARQATHTSPIPFPWKRAIPGFAAISAGLGILVRLAIITIQAGRTTDSQGDFLPQLHLGDLSALAMHSSIAPAALALAGAWLCVALARKMAG